MEENNGLEKNSADGDKPETVQPTDGEVTETGKSVIAFGGEQPHGKAKKIVRFVCACLGYALLAFLVVTLVWLVVDKYIKKSPAPGAFGYSPLIVMTGSMSATIEAGDMVIIHRQKAYDVNDIITFMPEDAASPTTHRIVGINDDGTFVTRGDANNTDDKDPVTGEMILGKVVSVIPKAGVFVKWVREPNGWIFFVVAGALIAIVIYFLCKRSSLRRR